MATKIINNSNNTNTLKYTLQDVNNIIYQGFNYEVPIETLEIISTLAMQVGSPDYVKTPVFQKRENPLKSEKIEDKDATNVKYNNVKKKKGNRATEIVNDEDWEAVRNFQTTKIEAKTGSDGNIDLIRVYINKITEKNYIDMRNKIIDVVENLESSNSISELNKISTNIFDIASSNRYYSKIYADLYSDLSSKFNFIKLAYEDNLSRFTDLFNNIEYVDPSENYDKFCEINKTNEKRKSLATFYINLMLNGVINKTQIKIITSNLLYNIYTFITEENKKNEVDELTETISILYKKEFYEDDNGSEYEKINGLTIHEIIEKLAKSKVKDYKSLTNKSVFKFMDLIDM
jgi:hypothetical protein